MDTSATAAPGAAPPPLPAVERRFAVPGMSSRIPGAPATGRRAGLAVLGCVLALCATGCGASGRSSTVTSGRVVSPRLSLRMCLRKHGYAVSPESRATIGTAPSKFDFVAVWNVLNPSRIALALTFSRDPAGAELAAAWTRHANARAGRGVVDAPVVRIGKVDVLWTAKPGAHDMNDVYGCVRRSG